MLNGFVNIDGIIINYLISLAIFYVGVGVVLNSLVTLWLMYISSRDGFNIRVQWGGWFLLSLKWPVTLYKIIAGLTR